MLHACVERFDVMGGRGNILGWDGEVNTPMVLSTVVASFIELAFQTSVMKKLKLHNSLIKKKNCILQYNLHYCATK
jgi:hypothetical protein